MIKTFRGLIASTLQDTVVLHTNTGSTGYKIVNFNVMPNHPFNHDQESVIKIYKIQQTTVDAVVDFSDNTLLAVGIFKQNDAVALSPSTTEIFFDNEIFNQDIYITCHDLVGSTRALNYYLELEQVKLDLNESTVATLKDIRNITAPA